ncbi:hypothetical protein [Microseira wollei]|uniref:Uncharacterized protein n=1 Tax=Microseira wollei NIES-4236 TaxID=2530354 RepID=A0AAV3XUH3_9CYAN|nr:hypothetical protein [Microseira wollei]GET44217.1 hypothetical protein MiSe_90430 [Microseira wollei NIES-4236]
MITDNGWEWSAGAPLSLPPDGSVGEDYALITIQDRIRTINATLLLVGLIDSDFASPSVYYFYASCNFLVGNLRAVNGRVDQLAQVTDTIGEPYAPIEVITPSSRWSPGSQPSPPPPEQEIEIVPRINRRLRRIIEEGEDRERMTCDFSLVIVALRQVLATNTNLPAQVTQAYLAINANINELKPPINTINATTQTTATTVNSVSNVFQSTATKVDDLAEGLTNVRTTVNTTAPRVQNVANKLDDVADPVNNVSTKLDDVGSAVNRTFNRLQEIFQEITKRLDRWAKWLGLPMLLDALSFILLLQAAMLSSNVVQTVGEILDTRLQIIGLRTTSRFIYVKYFRY